MRTNHVVNARLTIALRRDIDAVGYRGEAVAVATIAEQTSVAEVQARLTDKYPQFSPDDIATTVARVHARFDGSRIRDFVPLLVERGARAELSKAEPASR
jgi:hypothetical protein